MVDSNPVVNEHANGAHRVVVAPKFSRSALVDELRTLSAKQRNLLGIEDWVIDLVDIVVTSAVVLTDPSDRRTVGDRLVWLTANAPELPHTGDPEASADQFRDLINKRLEGWRRAFDSNHRKQFLRRLWGAAKYDRIVAGLITDGTAVADGIRQFASFVQPFAVAFDDCATILSPDKIRASGLFGDNAAISVLRLILKIDSALERLIQSEFDWSTVDLAEESHARDDDLSALIEQLRPVVSQPIRVKLAEINERLFRKLTGALTALELSEDGVSQAANSLVELIDTLLRIGFPDAEVVAWAEATSRTGPRYIQSANHRPTKRAQALCFVYGGRIIDNTSPLHELLAEVVVVARSGLERLKHADTGDPLEGTLIRTYFAAVEGFLTLAIRVGWATMPEADVDRIRSRLAA